MNEIIFSTGNGEKFHTAKHVCDKHRIKLIQRTEDIVEIQEEDPKKVAIDKATKAFELIKQPVVITDDSWAFSGLKGFPGVYMHSINEWFTTKYFLRLVLTLTDRKVTYTQYLVYTDGSQQKVFTKQHTGKLLKEIKGSSIHPSHTIITMDDDNGLSIAEVFDSAEDRSTSKAAEIWHDFSVWLTSN
jgi:non-canonical purine NTP pyrophosphatase (RdgB/HAM1 family)